MKRKQIILTVSSGAKANTLQLTDEAMKALSDGETLYKMSGDSQGDCDFEIRLVRKEKKANDWLRNTAERPQQVSGT